eukprot:7852836-Pyramimonas_sp.AAC.1
MCAELGREPHFENHPPSIREAQKLGQSLKTNVRGVRGESHKLKTTRPQSAKLSQMLRANVCGAKARTAF